MTAAPHRDWITPEDLAPQMQRSVRWVKDQMVLYSATGGREGLPSVKVGGTRYWTPGCMAELEARDLRREQADTWGRKTRRSA